MNQATDLLKFEPLCCRVVTAAHIPRHVMHSNAWERLAGRLPNPFHIPMRLDRTTKKLQVSGNPRQGCRLRVTNQMTSSILRTEPKLDPRKRVIPHKTQERVKCITKTCLRVGNAKVGFPSHSGIAYFAKVGPNGDSLHLYLLTYVLRVR
jgi:hypothetical protein